MKKFWILGGLLVLISGLSAVAQEDAPGKGQEVPAEGRVQPAPAPQPQRGDVLAPANLARELNLTEEQRARVEGLWKQYNDRNEALRRDTSLTPEQRIQRMRQNREEYVRLVRSLLNEEQLKKFEKLLEERAPAYGSMANMRFSPEQLEKLKEITQRYAKIRQQILQDQSLDPSARARRLQEINQQMLQEIRDKVLTPQQREQWDKALKKDQKANEKDKEGKDSEKDKQSPSGNP